MMISVTGVAVKSAERSTAKKVPWPLANIFAPARRWAATAHLHFKADHEARGITEIVSDGRPQLVMNSNRIAGANCGYKTINTVARGRAAKIARSGRISDARLRTRALGKSANRSAITCCETIEVETDRRTVAHVRQSVKQKRGCSMLRASIGQAACDAIAHVSAERAAIRLFT